MVTLDTLRKLHEHDHQLAAYCAACECWRRENLLRRNKKPGAWPGSLQRRV